MPRASELIDLPLIHSPSRTARYLLWSLPLVGISLALLVAFGNIAPSTALAQVEEPTLLPPNERLAEPTLPAIPSQADLGAQSFWLYCMPCHGDLGQGLTGEFRDTYPPEDRNCWTSGCHGNRPYEDGFTLPKVVPPLIGPETLSQFPTAGNLFGFIAATMPFQAPGGLENEDYWQITAFLLRENGVVLGAEPLNPENSMQVPFRPPLAPSPTQTLEPTSDLPANAETLPGESPVLIIGVAAILIGGIALLVALVVWMNRANGD